MIEMRGHGEDQTREGLETLARRIRELEKEGYRVEPWWLSPGTALKSQISNEDKVLAVLRGDLEVELRGQRQRYGPGDVFQIPHGVVHSLTVVGEERVYLLVALRQPPPIPPEAFAKGRPEG
jgi:quercetin dioxygenase-like cupin family protein